MAFTVGLVEDDDIIRMNFSDYLRGRGFDVRPYGDRQSALEAFRAELPDVAVLDVSLHRERDAGFRLCADIREFSKTLPVIFVTSYDSEQDRISGFRLGADDYLSKDCSMEFLAVRIEALMHRHQALQEGPGPAGSVKEIGPLRVDLRRAEATWKDQPVNLSLTQYWMVLELASTPTQPKSADALMKAAKIHVANNTIAAHIRGIRQRFTDVDPAFDAIRTERGLGYRWVVD